MTGLNIIGMPFGMHGLGQEMRDKAYAMSEAGIELCILEENYSSLTNRVDDKWILSKTREKPIYNINLICHNLPAINLLYKKKPQLFDNCYNIGAPYWEFPQLPHHHAKAFEYLDEVWVSNKFLTNIFSSYTDIPIVQMPLHIKYKKDPEIKKRKVTDTSPLIFGYVFDCNSMIERKNPLVLIIAFLKAFSNNKLPVKLILKYKYEPASYVNENDLHYMLDLAKLDKRIEMVDTALSSKEMSIFLKKFDVYVSPHRAEGLGRGVIEAMLNSQLVIATNYSGPEEFLDPVYSIPIDYYMCKVGIASIGDIKPTYDWADICIDSLSKSLKQAFSNVDLTFEMGKKSKIEIQKQCNALVHGEACLKRLKIIEKSGYKLKTRQF